MGFKEGFFNAVNKVSASVDKGVKAGKEGIDKMAEKARLKKEMGQLTTEIENIFSSVGRRMYNENPEHEVFGTVFSEVKEKEDQISKLKQQLNALDGISTCPSCGEEVLQTAATCPKCGAAIEHPVVEPEVVVGEVVDAANASVCSVCGAQLAPEAKFCNACGAKVEEQ